MCHLLSLLSLIVLIRGFIKIELKDEFQFNKAQKGAELLRG